MVNERKKENKFLWIVFYICYWGLWFFLYYTESIALEIVLMLLGIFLVPPICKMLSGGMIEKMGIINMQKEDKLIRAFVFEIVIFFLFDILSTIIFPLGILVKYTGMVTMFVCYIGYIIAAHLFIIKGVLSLKKGNIYGGRLMYAGSGMVLSFFQLLLWNSVVGKFGCSWLWGPFLVAVPVLIVFLLYFLKGYGEDIDT